MTISEDPPSPLWASLSRETFSAARLEGAYETDVAVIGAGISGLSTALHLARSGTKTLVIEAGEIGAGASGRNNGQVIPTLTRHDPNAVLKALGSDRGDRFLRLLERSADLLFETATQYGIDCDAVRNGWIQPAHSEGRARIAARRAEQWQARGVAAEVLSRDEIAAHLGSAAYYGGWRLPSGGHINPLAFTRGLARAAVAEGASVFTHSPVTSLSRNRTGWLLSTSTGSIRASKVVLATAAYSGSIWPELARSIVPVTSYQVATQPLDQIAETILPSNEACSDTRMDLRYFRKDRDGRLVSGGALAFQAFAKHRIPRLVTRRLEEIFPQLKGVRADFFWDGRIAMTPDRLPRLYRSADGLISWIGCNGRGLALSMTMGSVVADVVHGASDAELPLELSSPRAVPLSPLVSRMARLILPYYRYRDRTEIRG
jgi:glycine/D-amino acid oxidase-like deaminating enzyme